MSREVPAKPDEPWPLPGREPLGVEGVVLASILRAADADAGFIAGAEGVSRIRASVGMTPEDLPAGARDLVDRALREPAIFQIAREGAGGVAARALVAVGPLPHRPPSPPGRGDGGEGSEAAASPGDGSAGGPAERRRKRGPAAPGVVGVILLARSNGAFDPIALGELAPLADLGGVLIAEALRGGTLATDPETGLAARRELVGALAAHIGPHAASLALAIVGIEGFRVLREHAGRRDADALLRDAAIRLVRVKRAEDRAFRFGVGSFAVLLPETDRGGATKAAERFRRAVAGASDSLRVSVGFALHPEDATTAEGLVLRADQALFLAELEGGSRVRAFDPALAHFALRTDDLSLLTGDEERDRRNILNLLDTIMIVNQIQDRRAMLSAILDLLVEIGRADRGFLFRVGDGAPDPKVEIAQDAGKRPIDAANYAAGMVRQAIAKATPVHVVQGETRAGDAFGEELRGLGVGRALALPLAVKDRVLGAVYLDAFERGGEPAGQELVFLQALSRELGMAMENARLYEENLAARREVEALLARLSERVHEQERTIEEALAKNAALEETISTRYNYDRIIGKSKPMREVFRILDRVTDSRVPVLVTGESGTGKELIAKCLHLNGPRRGKRFVSVNCAAIADTLLETELFGHVRGAFTGAERDHQGLFEQADGGTIFLDEIQNMSPGMQRELLRVLQEGEIRPVGGKDVRKVDVRVISATNADLRALVRAGDFREDLYYRLHVIRIALPPLRDRKEDIPVLVRHFLDEMGAARGRSIEIEPRALALLMDYPWPGNVRELQNFLERATLMARDPGLLTAEDIDLAPPAPAAEAAPEASKEAGEKPPPGLAPELLDLPYEEARDRFTELYVRARLARHQGNVTRAAEEAGLIRSSLHKIMRRYGIDAASFK